MESERSESIISLPASPADQPHLPLSSIQAMLPSSPLPIRELSYLSSLETEEMVAVPPRLLTKQDKKPSLLSSILSRPPIETAASRQLSSLLSCKHSTSVAPGAPAHNFSVFDSLKQKDNGRPDLTVRTLPTLQTEGDQGGTCSNGDVRQIPPRKKLIINKRKKEIIHTQRGKILMPGQAWLSNSFQFLVRRIISTWLGRQ